MKPHALVVQKRTSGTPSSCAASSVKLMTPSETMQVTGGTVPGEQFSLVRRSLKGAKQFFLVEEQREGMFCVVSTFDVGGRPSGIVSNLNELRPLREWGPPDFSRRLWLNSVFTKVMWKPLW